MNFKEALKILNIEEYEERIINSNSHGELFHIFDYVKIAEYYKNKDKDISWFRERFIDVVNQAEEEWDRPESIFQHVLKIL